jgi:16S rRNA (cytosine967-C5)-methyltransferase
LAADVVTRVREREAYAHETLAAALNRARLDARDVGFATRLAYGTVACRGTLDEAVGRYLTKSSAVEPVVMDRLAVSAYELLFMRSPARAAVSQGVELVREVRPRAAGLANAVLRRLADDAEKFPWGDVATDNGALARESGHPRWLVELWVAELGRDVARRVLAADNEPAPLYLAHMPFSASFEATLAELADDGAVPQACDLPGCILAQDASAAVRSAALREHRVVVADGAAQLTAAVTASVAETRVIDIGAGRGTKSLLIAAQGVRTGRDLTVTAVDLHEFKLAEITKTAQALGVECIDTVAVDATNPDAPAVTALRGADVVLVDAPCSGLGTLRRHPDRRWRATSAEPAALAALGGRLLATAVTLVKPGGFVVYSTCTIARAENEDVIRAFLESGAGQGFEIDGIGEEVPAEWRDFVAAEGWFRSLPEPGGPDGHFIVRLRAPR